MSIWGPSPPHVLQIHSQHQFATGTLSHVPLRRRGIIVAIFRGFWTFQIGTWNRSAFFFLISYLIELENLQFCHLLELVWKLLKTLSATGWPKNGKIALKTPRTCRFLDFGRAASEGASATEQSRHDQRFRGFHYIFSLFSPIFSEFCRLPVKIRNQT